MPTKFIIKTLTKISNTLSFLIQHIKLNSLSVQPKQLIKKILTLGWSLFKQKNDRDLIYSKE